MRRLRAVATEPVAQFLALALLLHAVNAARSSGDAETFVLTEAEAARHEALWTARAGRPPTPSERAGLRAALTEEAALAREAVRLGLAEDDVVIRRRLAQKARAVLRAAPAPPPSEQAVRDWYEAHREDYAAPARASFRMIYLGEAEGGARAALSALAAGADWRALGEPAPFRTAYADATRTEIERILGERVAEAVHAAPTGVWTGPVRSPYGAHLVLVERREAGASRPLGEVRSLVTADLLRAVEAEAAAARIAEVVARHGEP